MFRKTLLLLLTAGCLNAQMKPSEEDSIIFYEKLEALALFEASTQELAITDIGKLFLDTPYVAKTLEKGNTETLIVNLRGFDCTTYVENVLAFGMMVQNEQSDFGNFTENLKTIRYRNGILDGYPSRLHYFTEWISNNQKKGLVTDITAELGGVSQKKAINFMGTHRELYPFLRLDENYEAMLALEEELAQENLCILPQDQIENQEHLIQSGDIIALATSIKGLDVTHTGFALKHNGRIHLLHASSSGSVRITQEPLADYLKKVKSNIGIIVARPRLLAP